MSKQKGDLGRHSTQCSICNHEEKEEIERLWCSGRSGRSLEQEFGLHHMSIIRHMRFFGLKLDIEAALEAIITSGMDGLKKNAATAAHANEAIKSVAKLRGLWVDRTEMLPVGWQDRSDEEIAFFAANGRFPRPDEEETVQ